MFNKSTQNYFLVFLIIVLLVVSYFVFKPFLGAFILAIVFAVVFFPFHKRILKRMQNYPSVASALSTITIVFFIVIPVTILSSQLIGEATNLYHAISVPDLQNNLPNSVVKNFDRIAKIFPEIKNLPSDLGYYLKQGLQLMVSNFSILFSSIAKILIGIFVFTISLYYLLRDGESLRKIVILVSPFADVDDETILNKLHLAVNSVFKGSLTIALIQGFLTAFGFAIFGIPNFVFWGTIAGICSLIPSLGTSLIIIPGAIYLFLSGLNLQALGLVLWGACAVGLIDNLLGPKLIGKGIAVHPLLILFSVLGGISFFGPIGFILGPLFVTLFFSLVEIYISSTKNNIKI